MQDTFARAAAISHSLPPFQPHAPSFPRPHTCTLTHQFKMVRRWVRTMVTTTQPPTPVATPHLSSHWHAAPTVPARPFLTSCLAVARSRCYSTGSTPSAWTVRPKRAVEGLQGTHSKWHLVMMQYLPHMHIPYARTPGPCSKQAGHNREMTAGVHMVVQLHPTPERQHWWNMPHFLHSPPAKALLKTVSSSSAAIPDQAPGSGPLSPLLSSLHSFSLDRAPQEGGRVPVHHTYNSHVGTSAPMKAADKHIMALLAIFSTAHISEGCTCSMQQ